MALQYAAVPLMQLYTWVKAMGQVCIVTPELHEVIYSLTQYNYARCNACHAASYLHNHGVSMLEHFGVSSA